MERDPDMSATDRLDVGGRCVKDDHRYEVRPIRGGGMVTRVRGIGAWWLGLERKEGNEGR